MMDIKEDGMLIYLYFLLFNLFTCNTTHFFNYTNLYRGQFQFNSNLDNSSRKEKLSPKMKK